MPVDDQSRRGFLVGAGLVAGSLVGDAVLPQAAEAQARQSGTPAAPASRSARFRAAIARKRARRGGRRRVLINGFALDQQQRAKKYGVVRS